MQESIFKILSTGKSSLEDLFEVKYLDVLNFQTIGDDKAGIYSWHFYSDQVMDEKIREYFKIMHSKSYKVNVDGNLHSNFSGNLDDMSIEEFKKREFSLFDLNTTGNKTTELMKVVTSLFSPPIYIGRSKDLQTRLTKHYDQFTKHLQDEDGHEDALSDGKKDLSNDFDSEDIDKPEESEYFGSRLAYYFQKRDETYELTFNESNLFVKVLILKDLSLVDHLVEIEYILNRTYTPTFGRK